MKKLASLLLVFALALSLAVPCFAANEKEIKVITPPNKTSYAEGDTFDPAGMRLQSIDTSGNTTEIAATDNRISFQPDPKKGEKLKAGQTSVTIIFKTDGDKELSTAQEITVSGPAETPAPSPTPAPDTSAAPFISS